MKKLQLREGKYYLRRDGITVGPMEWNDYYPHLSKYQFCWCQHTYMKDGSYYDHGREAQYDLLREATKSGHPIRPTTKKHTGGRGTVKGWAFVARHGHLGDILDGSVTREMARLSRQGWIESGYSCTPIVPISLPAPKASPDVTTPKPATKAKGKI